jgi:hypothetical protein
MISKLASLLFAGLVIVVSSSSVQADQFVARHGGRQVVVHTSPLPVFLHRAAPPNYGRHITLREYRAQQHGRSVQRSR